MTQSFGRALGVLQIGVGAVLVCSPGRVAAQVPRWIVRTLGVRGVVQGAVLALEPGPATLTVGAAIDATHALSMTPFVVGSARFRRPAAVSGGTAALMAFAGAALARAEQRAAVPA